MDELWGKKVEKGKTENLFEMNMNKLVYKYIDLARAKSEAPTNSNIYLDQTL